MKRKAAFILSTIIVVAILVAAMLSIAGAAPLPNQKIFSFTKTIDKSTVTNGDLFTVTLAVNPIALTDNITFTIADPNVVYPGWLEIVTGSVATPAVYDPVLDTVFWNGSIGPSSQPQSVQFQMRVKSSAVIPQATVLTNTAYVGIDPAYAASLPVGSLPGSLPPSGSLPYGMHGAAWATLTAEPGSACTPITQVNMNYLPVEPVIGQWVLFTASYLPANATPSSITWDFGGLFPGSGVTTTHLFEGAGKYTVTLTVIDDCGTATVAEQLMTVLPGTVQEIGPAGGSLVYTSTTGTGVVVDVPAGALSETISLVYAPQPAPKSAPTGQDYGGTSFSLDAYNGVTLLPGYVFNQPLTFTVYYSGTPVNETSLKLFYENINWFDVATTCDPTSTYLRNFEANYFQVGVCHLSKFATFGVTEYKLYLPLMFKIA